MVKMEAQLRKMGDLELIYENVPKTACIKIVINAGDGDLPNIRMGYVIYDS